MMADTAVVPQILEETYRFSSLRGGANVLVFSDLNAANTAYKLLARIGEAETIGPLLMGMSKPVHVLARRADDEEIINIAAIAVVDAQEAEKHAPAGQAREEEPEPLASLREVKAKRPERASSRCGLPS